MPKADNYVQLVGMTWGGYEGAYEYPLTPNQVDEIEVIADIRSLSAKPGDLVQDEILREDVEEWLHIVNNRPDFATVIDFTAVILGTDIEWFHIENASVYNETMGEDEEDYDGDDHF